MNNRIAILSRRPALLAHYARITFCGILGAFVGYSQVLATTPSNVAVTVNKAPTLNNGTIDGAVQQLEGEKVTIKGSTHITGDYYLPGTPVITLKNNATYDGTIEGTGALAPSGYVFKLLNNVELASIITRTDPTPLPSVIPPSQWQGTRTVNLNHPAEDPGDFSTLKNLTLNSNAGTHAVPGGVYRNFTVNSNATLTLGDVNATTPVVYELNKLTLNDGSTVDIVSPVTLILGKKLIVNGTGCLGNINHPEWLTVKIASGGLDMNGSSLLLGSVQAPSSKVTINSTATITGTIFSNKFILNGNGQVNYHASGGGTGNQDAPVADNQELETDENIQLTVLLTGSDPNDDPLTFSIVSNPTNGTLSGSPPVITYTPNTDFTGIDSFSLVADDGALQSSEATISITVNAVGGQQPNTLVSLVRHAPKINSGTVDGSIQQLLGENANINGGSVITGSLLVPGTPSIRLNGNPTYGGTIEGSGSSTPSGYQITLNGNVELGNIITRTDPVALPVVNEPPQPTGTRVVNINNPGDDPGDFATLRDLTLNGNVGDIAVPAGTYGKFIANSNSSFELGTVGATVPEVYNLQELILNGNSSLSVNGPIIINLKKAFTTNGQSGSEQNPDWLRINVYNGGVTLNGGSSIYGVIVAPNGEVTLNGNTILKGSVASDELTLNGNSQLSICEDIFGGGNEAPIADAQTVNQDEDTASTITLTGSDPDNDPLTYIIQTLPTHGELSYSGGTVIDALDLPFTLPSNQVTFTPGQNDVSNTLFTFKVNDGTENSDAAIVTLTLNPVNDAPVATPLSVTVLESGTTDITLIGSDIDGDTLSFAIDTFPGHGSLTTQSGTLIDSSTFVIQQSDLPITYTHQGSNTITDSFTYQATDGILSSSPATVDISITPINNAPIITEGETITVVMSEDGSPTPFTLTLNATDAEGDTLSWSNSAASNGSASLTTPGNSTIVSYTPNANFNGSDSFTVTVDDSNGGTDAILVNVTIDPVNDAPSVLSVSAVTIDEDMPTSIAIVVEDIDTATLTVTPTATNGIITPGTIDGTGATKTYNFTYTPTTDFNGPANYSVDFSDGDSVVPATEIITVNPINDAPVSVADTATTDEDTLVIIDILANDTDVDAGDILTIASIADETNGTVVINGNNTVTFTPAADFIGTASFTYIAQDNNSALSASSAVTITVNNVNDAPAITSTAITSADEDLAYSYTVTTTDADAGDVVTVTAPTLPSWLTFDGTTLSGTPTNAEVGDHAVVLTATDLSGATDTQGFTVAVNNVNDAPEITSTAITSADEDLAYSYTVTTTDADAGDVVTVTAPTLPSWLTFDGITLSGTPTNAEVGDHAVVLTATDLSGATDTQSFTVTVNNANDAPAITSTAITSVDEDAIYSYIVTTTDADAGDVVTVTATTLPAWLTFDGTTLNGTPTNAEVGLHDVELTATDLAGLTDTQNFTITVSNINDAPISVADSATTNEDESTIIDVLANDTDADFGDTLSIASITNEINGTATINGDNTVTFAPVSNFTGTASFTYIAQDTSSALSAPSPVTITVSPVNDAPEITSTAITSVDEDTIYTYTVTTNDIDAGDVVTVTADTLPVWLSFDGTTLNGTPTNADIGAHAVVLTATDLSGATDTQSFTITVNNVNDAPVITSTAITSVDEDTAYTYVVTTSDPDAGDAVTVTATTLPVWLTFDGTTLSGTPTNAEVGTHSVELTATDLAGLTDTQTFIITVNNINDAPVSVADVATTNEDESVIINVLANDIDVDAGDTLTVASIADETNGTATINGDNTVTFTPAANFIGTASFTYIAQDNNSALSASSVVTITVSNVNDAPVITSTAITTVDEDSVYTYTVTTTDADTGDVVTVTAPTLPAWLSFDGTTLSGTPTNAEVGDHAVVLTATDLSGATDTQSFTVTVNNVNDAPVITSTAITTVDEDSVYTYTVTTTDADAGDVVTVTAPTLPSWLTFDGTTLSGTPSNAEVGDHAVVLTATDLSGATDTQSFTVTVNNVNDAPVITSTAIISVDEDLAYSYTVTTTDADTGDVVTVTAPTLPSWLTFDGTTLSGTPSNAEVGDHAVVLTATDLSGATDTQSFTVTVNNVNDAPVITSTAITSVDEDLAYSYTVTTTDSDAGDVVTVTAPTLPSWLTFDGTTLSGTPSNAEVGDHAVVLTATDLSGATDTQSFTVTVNNVNDAPVITSTAITSVNEDVAYTYTVTTSDPDVGDIVTVTTPTLPAWLTFDGTTLNGTPTNSEVGSHPVELIATDIAGLTDTQNFTITVNAVNDIPTLDAPIADITVDEDAADTTIDLANVFSDVDSALEFSAISSDETVATVSIVGTDLVIDYLDDASGVSTITVTAAEVGGTNPISDDFTVTVNAVNDIPTLDAPIADITVDEDSADTTIDLANVFSDVDSTLEFSASSSDETIVAVAIVGTDLIIDYLDNASGVSTITVTAAEVGGTNPISDDFTVTVNAVNDIPTLDAPIADITVDEDAADTTIDLANVFSDVDSALEFSAISSDETVATVSIVGTDLVIDYLDDASGVSTITVTAAEVGGTNPISDDFTVTVNAVNDIPTLDAPIADITVDEDSADTTIDLANVFSDVDSTLEFSASSSDETIVAVAIVGTDLIIDYLDNASGVSTITVTAAEVGGTNPISDDFTVTVNAVNDIPTLDAPIADITVDEDAADTTIDLANVFSDIDSTLEFSASSSDETIATVSISGTNLVIDYLDNANGVSTITVTAAEVGDTNPISDDFTVTVNAVNDIPTLDAPIADITVDEDAADTTIDLANVFSDVDSVLEFSALSSDETVATVSISGTNLVIDYLDDANGVSTITVTAAEVGGTNLISDELTVTVNPVNDAPISIADTAITNEDESIIIDVLANDTDADSGDTLTIASVADETNGTATINGDNTITFTPAANFNGTASFTYIAQDTSSALSASSAVTITVNPVNDAPEITSTPITSTNEDTLYAYTVTTSDIDTGDVVTVTATTLPAWLIFDGTTLSGTPTNAEVGDHSVLLTATDIAGLTDIQSFTITVNNINDAPVAVDDAATTNEDESVIIDVLANDTDPDLGDVLIVASIANETNGTATINGDNTVTFTPAANFNGTASFTYIAQDTSSALSASSAVTITVNAVNDVPTLDAPIADITVDEDSADTTINLANVFSDVDSALEFSAISSDETVATVSIVGTDLIIDYLDNVSGVSTITVTAAELGGSNPISDDFIVTVNAVNDVPTLDTPIADITVDEDSADTTIDLANIFSDVDSVLEFIAISSDETVATVSIAGTDLVIDYLANASGVSTITVTAAEVGGTNPISDDFTVTVNAINDIPVSVADSATTDEDTSVIIDILVNDTDPDTGDTLTIASIADETNGTATINGDNTVTFTPAADFNGTASFTYIAQDASSALSASSAVTITVNPINDAPEISSTAITVVDEDTAYTYTVTTSDVDSGDVATVTADTLPTWLSFDGTTLSGTPTNNEVGDHAVVLTATDLSSATDTQSFTVTVNNINDAPIAVADSATTNEDESVIIDVLANDTDPDTGDTLTIASIADETNGTVTINGDNTVTFTPTADFNGTASFTYIAQDSNSTLSASSAVTITVNPVNDAPEITSTPITTANEDTLYSYSITFSDIDTGDSVSISSALSVVPAFLTLTDNNDGTATLTGTPTNADVGDHPVSIVVEDTTGATATQPFTLTVIGVNDAPILAVLPFSVSEDTPTSIILEASDPDGDTLTTTITVNPQFGTLTPSAPQVFPTPTTTTQQLVYTYTPNPDYNGTDVFQFEVTDGQGETVTTTITPFDIIDINDAPVSLPTAVTTEVNTPVTFTLSGTDADGDLLSFSIVTAANAGWVLPIPLSIAAPATDITVEYYPAEDYVGTDEFTFIVSDFITGSITAATVLVNINPDNIAPVVNAGEDRVISNAAMQVALTGTVEDDGISIPLNISWSQLSGPGNTTFSPSDTETSIATFDTIGNYVLELAADDGEFFITDTVNVLIEGICSGATISPNAVSWWKGENNEDDALLNTELILNDAVYATGFIGQGFGFDGTESSRVVAPFDSLFASSNFDIGFSIEFWFNPNDQTENLMNWRSASENGAVNFTVSNDESLYLWVLDVGGTWTPYIMNGFFSSNSSDPNGWGNWIHLALTHDANTKVTRVWRNGQQVLDLTINSINIPQTANLHLGGSPGSNSNFTGFLDEPAIYEDVLDSSEVLDIYTAGTLGKCDIETPLAIDQFVQVERDSSTVITLQGTDFQGDLLTFEAIQQPTNGTLTPSDLTTLSAFSEVDVIYTPNPGYTGSDSFTFRVNDGFYDSNVAQVDIEVTEVNQAPVIITNVDEEFIITSGTPGLINRYVIINNDEWVFTKLALDRGSDSRDFARNVASLFADGGEGKFLINRVHRTRTMPTIFEPIFGQGILNTLRGAGHMVDEPSTFDFTLEELLEYDGIFLAANDVDNQLLIQYVENGGSVFLQAGSIVNGYGSNPAAVEASWWNEFLNFYDLGYGDPYNGIEGVLPVNSDHPLVSNVDGLYYGFGNPLVLLNPERPNIEIVTKDNDGTPLIALWKGSSGYITLDASVIDDGLPIGSSITGKWSFIAGPGEVFFDDENLFTTGVSMEGPGVYTFRFTATDGEITSTKDINVSVVFNQAPLISVPSAIGVRNVPTTLTIDANTIDDGLVDPLQIQWTQRSGPASLSIVGDTGEDPTLSITEAGIYRLEFSVFDGDVTQTRYTTVYADTTCQVEVSDRVSNWWTFDGHLLDVFGGDALKGVNTPTPLTYADAVVAKGLSFEDTNDRLEIAANDKTDIGTEGDFTIEFWLSTDDVTSLEQSILHWDNGGFNTNDRLKITLNSNSQFNINFVGAGRPGGTNVSSTTSANVGEFYHVAMAYDYDLGEMKIYVNGVLEKSDSVGTVLADSNHDLYIGFDPKSPSGSGNPLSGVLDELTFYKSELTPTEIFDIYTAGAAGKCPINSNAPPAVDAGPDKFLSAGLDSVNLTGSVSDDDLPVNSGVISNWSLVDGPGSVTIAEPNLPITNVTFEQGGVYLFELTANDGAIATSDFVEVRVGIPCVEGVGGDPISWWPLNQSALDPINSQNMQVSGGELYTSGILGRGLQFNGSSNFALVPQNTLHDLSENDAYSIEFWMNPTASPTNDQYLITWSDLTNNEVTFRLNNNSQLIVNLRIEGVGTQSITSGNNAISLNTFNHVAFTKNVTTGLLQLFINGVLVETENVTPGQRADMDSDLYFGYNPLLVDNHFEGILDEVSFYNRLLTGGEISAIYNSNGTEKCPTTNNSAPIVSAGTDIGGATNQSLTLAGFVTDDGLPSESILSTQWSVLYPASANFTLTNGDSTNASIEFADPGTYLIQLLANDGMFAVTDYVTARIEAPCSLQLPSDAIAWYPADADGRDVVGGNDADLVSGTSIGDGQVLRSFNFDGSNDDVSIANDSTFDFGANNKSFTIEFWAQKNSNGGQVYFYLGNGTTPGIRIWGDSNLRFDIYSTTGGLQLVNGNGVINTGQWYHIAATYDATTSNLALFLNGSLVQSFDYADFTPRTDGDIRLGYDFASQYFNGAIDELTIYERNLSGGEIAAIYNAGSIGKCSIDTNEPPFVEAGVALNGASNTPIQLSGVVVDDGLPIGATLNAQWNLVSGPGTVNFSPVDTDLNATATFSTPGIYTLELVADDGVVQASDTVQALIDVQCYNGLANEIISWWPATTDASDIIGSNNGIFSGATIGEGYVGSGFDFDGSNDTIRIPTSPELDFDTLGTSFSFELWAKADSLVRRPIFSRRSGATTAMKLTVDSSNLWYELRSTSNENLLAIASGLSANTWFHVVGTYDHATKEISIYLDGALKNSATSSDANYTPNTQYDIFLGNGFDGEFFGGNIDEFTFYNRVLSATEVADLYTADFSGKCFDAGTNVAPIVITANDTTISLPQSQLNVATTVIDDGFPLGNDLTVTWSQISGPAGVIFTPASVVNPAANSISTTIDFLAEGVYQLQVSATDGEFTAFDSFTVTVESAANQAPIVYAGPDVTVALLDGVDLQGLVTDDGLPEGVAPVIQWFKISGPDYVFVDDPSDPTTFANFGDVGTYVLRLNATDSEFNTSDEVTVNVVFGPEVFLNTPANNTAIEEGTSITLNATAFDNDGTIASLEFFANGVSLGQGTPIGGTNDYELTTSFPIGGYDITATATDNAGFTFTSLANTLTVVPVGGTALPDALIISPVEDTLITEPVTITGSATSAVLKEYRFQFRLKGETEWQTAFTGTTSVTNGDLGTFDPTLLLNGIYEVRLQTEDLLGNTITDGRSDSGLGTPIYYIVDSNMKVGHFQLTFEDLNVPVSGLPIQVLRTYDSRDNRLGDFGRGWTLGVRNIRMYKNRNLATGYQLSDVGSIICPILLQETDRHIITIVFPDDEVYQFEAKAVNKNTGFDNISSNDQCFSSAAGGTPVSIIFEPINGTVGTLEVEGENEAFLDAVLGPVSLITFPNGNDFNPTLFKFTTLSGDEFIIDETDGLVSMTDRNGNTLTVNENGIFHSSGKNITFTRDANGCISRITDPDGNELIYEYDTDDCLTKYTDREGNNAASNLFGTFTQYLYENPNFPSYLTEILDPRGISAIRSDYDSEGRLISQTDADGNSIDFDHDIPNKRETITDRLGVQTIHEYDLEGNVVKTITVDPNNLSGSGLETQYAYDANENEILVIDPLGNRTERIYDLATDNLLSETQRISDGQGGFTEITTTFTYDDFGNPETITDSRNNTTNFVYDAATGDLTDQLDAENNLTTFAYDSAGNLETMTDAEGNVTTNGYDGSGNLTSTEVRDAANNLLSSSTFTYDGNGNQLTQTTLRTLYDDQGNTTGTENLLTQFEYDNENRIIKTTFPDSTFTRVEYNAIGKQSKSYDPFNRLTEMFYDDRGNRVRMVYPDLTEETMVYDLENRRLSTTDRIGNTTYFVYDELGRMTTTIFPDATMPVDPTAFTTSAAILASAELADNPRTSTDYDSIGRVETSYDERGNPTSFAYDPNCGCSGRRNTVTNALNQVTNFAYDENGNQLSMTDANTHSTSFDYDKNNRPTQTTFHDGTFTETIYDSLNRRIAEIDQEGKRTDFEYDGLGRLVKVLQPSPDGVAVRPETSYTYDEVGNLIAQTDAETRTTRYQYDNMGRRVKRILPEGQVETMTYDAVGNLKTKTDFNGYTTTYFYDDLDRLIEKEADLTHPSVVSSTGPAFIVYTYDDAGRRTAMATLDATRATIHQVTYAYDERNRLTTRTGNHGTLSYTYDATSNLASVQSSNANGVDLGYGYDALNRLETVSDHGASVPAAQHGYTYDDVGNLETLSYANNLRHTWAYSSLNRLTNISIAAINDLQNPIMGYTYTLRDSGHRSQMAELTGRVVDYQYDNLYRLKQESIANDPFNINGNIDFNYDLVGNRLSQSSSVPNINNQSLIYSDNDWLTTDTYDSNGNTTNSLSSVDGTTPTTDEYDFENRLIRRTSGTKTINISYDADGNRVSKTVSDSTSGTNTTYYLVDTNNLTGYAQVVEEFYNNGGNLETYRSYTYGLDLIAQHQLMPPANPTQWETSYYMYDGLGTVRALTDDNGFITDAYTYSAFGELLNVQSSGTATPNAFLYTGEQYDSDLGMYFLRARYMNPTNGRFHNMDVFEGVFLDPISLHKYAYANLNPVSYNDPSGFATLTQTLVGLSVVGVLATQVGVAYKAGSNFAEGKKVPDAIFVGGRVDLVSSGRGSRGLGATAESGFLYDFRTRSAFIASSISGKFDPVSALIGTTKRIANVSGVVGLFWNLGPASDGFSFGGFNATYSTMTVRAAAKVFSNAFGSNPLWTFLNKAADTKGLANVRIQIGITGKDQKTYVKFFKADSSSMLSAGLVQYGGLIPAASAENRGYIAGWVGGGASSFYENPDQLGNLLGRPFSL